MRRLQTRKTEELGEERTAIKGSLEAEEEEEIATKGRVHR